MSQPKDTHLVTANSPCCVFPSWEPLRLLETTRFFYPRPTNYPLKSASQSGRGTAGVCQEKATTGEGNLYQESTAMETKNFDGRVIFLGGKD